MQRFTLDPIGNRRVHAVILQRDKNQKTVELILRRRTYSLACALRRSSLLGLSFVLTRSYRRRNRFLRSDGERRVGGLQ